MSEQEKAEKAIRETAKKYFENHMAGKDINTVLYEVSKKVIFELGSVLG